jgi:hypothetical protein
MGNKKNKHNQRPQTAQASTNAKSAATLSDTDKQQIEAIQQNLEAVESAETLSQEGQSKLHEAERREDLSGYWNTLKDIHKRLESLLNSTKEEKDKTAIIKEELDSSRKQTDVLNADLKKKIDEYNKKDKELTEREFAMDSGEFTGVVRRLLESLKETERKIFTDTENLLKELSDFHKRNLEEFNAQIPKSYEIEKQAADLAREKKKFEVEKQIFQESLQEDLESKYSTELQLKQNELERLKRRVSQLEEENARLKQMFEDFQNAFSSTDPSEILMQQSFLEKELNNLKKELNERPERYEIDAKQAKIEELQTKVFEYQSKINETELLQLKNILNNSDSYVIELNTYKNQLETAKIREASLKKTIQDLQGTIDQLKGESDKKSDAFEFAKKCDADTDLQYNHLQKSQKPPKDLAELASYLQHWMASRAELPLIYSIETIRIFLAGLHMSPISILQGISGTGKTSLPREFAKALIGDENYHGKDEWKQNKAPYRICAVQSGWRDSMDLMGYYNSFEHKYKETDFFRALYMANQPKYSDTLFLIILDEMNLSRPEHYFADFLSLLEQPANEQFIGFPSAPEEVLPILIKGGKLRVPENVRFIGTANHDETTLEFAPKTYDRSNVLEMPRNHPRKEASDKFDSNFNVSYSWLQRQFTKAGEQHKEPCGLFHSFLQSREMKDLLDKKGIGIGNRLEKQAERFISVYVESGKSKEKDTSWAADHLITSRLLRSLKNRYDLDKGNMTQFKDEYSSAFKKHFKHEPHYAIALLDAEIDKK